MALGTYQADPHRSKKAMRVSHPALNHDECEKRRMSLAPSSLDPALAPAPADEQKRRMSGLVENYYARKEQDRFVDPSGTSATEVNDVGRFLKTR